MTKEHILVVEDDENIRELITYNLVREGFVVVGVSSSEDALRKIQTNDFDAILLDLMLPGVDGLEFCKQLKKSASKGSIPVIIITAKGEESDVVAGLEIGADDYIVKPFSPRVLLARIKSILRRKGLAAVEQTAILTFDTMVIHPGRHLVSVSGSEITLTHMEFKVLYFLANHPGWVFTRSQIVEGVRGDNYPVTDRSADVIIVGLRKKLGSAGNSIETVRGVGYRFDEQRVIS